MHVESLSEKNAILSHIEPPILWLVESVFRSKKAFDGLAVFFHFGEQQICDSWCTMHIIPTISENRLQDVRGRKHINCGAQQQKCVSCGKSTSWPTERVSSLMTLTEVVILSVGTEASMWPSSAFIQKSIVVMLLFLRSHDLVLGDILCWSNSLALAEKKWK